VGTYTEAAPYNAAIEKVLGMKSFATRFVKPS
jgi:hypothetical protein